MTASIKSANRIPPASFAFRCRTLFFSFVVRGIVYLAEFRVGGAGEAGSRASASSPGPDNLLRHHPAVRCSGNYSASSSIWRARAAVAGIRHHATGRTIFTLAESRISKPDSSRHHSSASHPTGASFFPVPPTFSPGTRASHKRPDDSARSPAGGCPAVALHPAPGKRAIPRRFPDHAAPGRRRS